MKFPSVPITVRRLAIATLILAGLCLAACATVPQPPPSGGPGKTVETLQSEVSLSIKAGDKSISGRGYLLFKHPDRFHMVVLSPFGFTLMDIYVANEHITCLIPAKQIAYQGSITELPDRNALKGWGMMRWVVDMPPVTTGAGVREYRTAAGNKELFRYDERGLLVSKENDAGDRVTYQNYHDRAGVAFPDTIELQNAQGDTVRIVFDQPELNQPVDDAVLTPSLAGITVLPLTAFRGI